MPNVVETSLALEIGVARKVGMAGFLDFARNDKMLLEMTKGCSE